MVELPGRAKPSTSARMPIVEAVPIVLQAPWPQESACSASRQVASSSRPDRRSSHSRHRSVPVPSLRPRSRAGGRAPAVTTSVGRLVLAAPISAPGTVLSQLASRRSPSMGWLRVISSISIARRLR